MNSDGTRFKPLPKRILLFADGTRNGSERFNSTNVWRMYQATDAGPHPEINQVSRYIDGVGSSSFTMFSIVQSVFAVGLKRNVVNLYTFLCSNYQEGDQICLFGFSRGAFTVRILADLIDKYGLVLNRSPEELEYLTQDVYRAYRQLQVPRMFPMRALLPIWRLANEKYRRVLRKLGRREYFDPDSTQPAMIDFIGVWDTVGAYGGPFEEIVDAVDKWVVPIGFPDTRLPDCVICARHVLALDEERQSFKPIPWNEDPELEPGRIEQVWFAGVHSDVGGGYVDDRLANTTLLWMMEEAEKCADVRFLDFRRQEVLLVSDWSAPIHDSRKGLGRYYRYRPRNLEDFTRSTPSDKDHSKGPQRRGLEQPVKIHESVFLRMISGTDGYAPIGIPPRFKIVPTPLLRETQPQGLVGPVRNSPIRTLALLEDDDVQKLRSVRLSEIWDYVWLRRVSYFGVVAASLLLLAAPLWIAAVGETVGSVSSDLLATPWFLLGQISPTILFPWFDALGGAPWTAAALCFAVAASAAVGNRLETRIRRIARSAWQLRPQPDLIPERRRSATEIIRTNPLYLGIMRGLSRQVIPSVIGLSILLLGMIGIVSLGSIARMGWAESQDIFCARRMQATEQRSVQLWMSVTNPCNRTGLFLEKGRRYEMTFWVPEGQGWSFGGIGTSPQGAAAGTLPLGADLLLLGTRRARRAKWMQPLLHIIPGNRIGPIVTRPISLSRDNRTGAFHGDFVAPSSGTLALAVNQAIPPWPAPAALSYDAGPRHRGISLEGGACVAIREFSPGRKKQEHPVSPGPECVPPPL